MAIGVSQLLWYGWKWMFEVWICVGISIHKSSGFPRGCVTENSWSSKNSLEISYQPLSSNTLCCLSVEITRRHHKDGGRFGSPKPARSCKYGLEDAPLRIWETKWMNLGWTHTSLLILLSCMPWCILLAKQPALCSRRPQRARSQCSTCLSWRLLKSCS